jgi:polar amino acid transport system substrate-binding protein
MLSALWRWHVKNCVEILNDCVRDRACDYEPLALALNRDDAYFRLIVDRTPSQLYRTGNINAIYEQYLGKPDKSTKDWFRKAVVPE